MYSNSSITEKRIGALIDIWAYLNEGGYAIEALISIGAREQKRSRGGAFTKRALNRIITVFSFSTTGLIRAGP